MKTATKKIQTMPKPTFIGKTLRYLNGKKTIIGLVLLQLCSLPVLADYPEVVFTLQWLGGMLTGIGITHKLRKNTAQ